MPRLQILQHKSYHPYLEKNKERVRQDEARAREEELAQEQKRLDNEAEHRLTLLRRRANSPTIHDQQEEDLPSTSSRYADDSASTLLEKHRQKKVKEEKRERKKRERLDFDFPSQSDRKREKSDIVDHADLQEGGHFNFFAQFEKELNHKPEFTLAEVAKKKKEQEKDPFTVYLSRPERETNPWYTDPDMRRYEEKEVGEEAEVRRDRERRKDARAKNRNDPLTNIDALFASHSSASRNGTSISKTISLNSSSAKNSTKGNANQSERQRALAMLAKSKQRVENWMDTPNTAYSGSRNWADDWERAKDQAGRRFFDSK
ncbi:hypothetical protein CNBG_3278 [Cryptococcus deuterogattii R265]|uniref:CBF1-interacting co-repressor CIR N-terminal domain-containing protein n=1 Tax=Cryptococcus deuterogattii (strain R265) TaxID=294750 RepID=A0A095CA22_CRYD2|nr:hypothetical protein CNBG_3278 [Cryptococcus deuterogattii R265]KIR74951.1 hypothetical protein I310_01225 [Cryptococcus deuterogattii CA1014]